MADSMETADATGPEAINTQDYPGWESDPLGQALLAYQTGQTDARILTWSDLEGYDYLPAQVLMREEKAMPLLEQHALGHCGRKVLELGAGAGSHALALQARGCAVLALDHSPGAVRVMEKRGVREVLLADLWHFEGRDFDTVLALMNGSGLAGDLPGFSRLLSKVISWLSPGGSFLLDSANLLPLFTDVPGGQYLDLTRNYYGETVYRMKFGKARSQAFGWLFLDFDTMAGLAEKAGFSATCLYRGSEDEFLAQLTLL